MKELIRSTTVLGIVRNGKAAMAADGQVTMGDTVLKGSARKLRRLYSGTVLAGFSGTGADAFALVERLEEKLETARGNLPRAAVNLAREWRTDKYLRQLKALIAAVDREHALLIGGSGEIVESEDGIVSVGSGQPYAIAAARALDAHTRMGPARIVRESLRIASGICIYTGGEIQIEELR
ncbi:MAG: ATP-dependent protease subunit HslV [Candidatus Aegiribacteria sp.]|nr:ATP-dependent protease subunit HslV [Candidatus Aegiribacteria sp.]MBD3295621.1 ATP-dependent protease subunit HslV [Candidatus Fermentibacteria bacterium]